MGAPVSSDPAKVSFLASFTQPDAGCMRNDDDDDTLELTALISQDDPDACSSSSIRKRPSIIIGGDCGALAAVRTVHSPRASGSSSSTTPRSLSSPSITASSTANAGAPRGAWRRKLFASGWTGPTEVVLSVVALVLSVRYYGTFLRWNETRSDIAAFAALSDPVLPHVTAVDCSAVLSVLVYGGILMAFRYTHNKPDVFLECGQTHAAVIWVRMLALYLTPLEAPPGTLPLVDPIAYPDGVVLVRDLFFSGHTATTFGLFIIVRRQDAKWRVFFALLTLLTATLVIVQKAHYTIDVLAAPCFVHTTHSVVVAARQWASAAFTATRSKSTKDSKQFRSSTKMKSF